MSSTEQKKIREYFRECLLVLRPHNIRSRVTYGEVHNSTSITNKNSSVATTAGVTKVNDWSVSMIEKMEGDDAKMMECRRRRSPSRRWWIGD